MRESICLINSFTVSFTHPSPDGAGPTHRRLSCWAQQDRNAIPLQLACFELAGVIFGGRVRHALQQDIGDAQPLQKGGRPIGGLVG